MDAACGTAVVVGAALRRAEDKDDMPNYKRMYAWFMREARAGDTTWRVNLPEKGKAKRFYIFFAFTVVNEKIK